MNDSLIAVVPIDVIQDKRLTLEQMRVLVALFSFRNKVTNTVWPSRAAIAERTGMHPSNISTATTALVALGWLTKTGLGGHSKATRYTLCVPELAPTTVAHSATVADTATVAHSAMPTVADAATPPLADSATRKELSIEQSIEQSKGARAKAPSVVFVLPDWIPSDAWAAFMETRKAKKAKSTDYALRLIVKSLEGFKAAGHEPLDILNNSIKAGWSDVYAPKGTASAMTAKNTSRYAGAAAAIFGTEQQKEYIDV